MVVFQSYSKLPPHPGLFIRLGYSLFVTQLLVVGLSILEFALLAFVPILDWSNPADNTAVNGAFLSLRLDRGHIICCYLRLSFAWGPALQITVSYY